MKSILIPETVVEYKRLGRHVQHDPRSRNFAFSADPSTPLKRVLHQVYGGVLDQGNVGSCTGNATAGAINTTGLHVPKTRLLRETDALEIYALATKLDEWPGEYPGQDTGSSGLAAAKAAQQKGLIARYEHAFDINAALQALQKTALITGVNWYEGFDRPDANGRVSVAGSVRGGHEFMVIGYRPSTSSTDAYVIAQNSWGTQWGVKGRFNFTVATWERLLSEDGDATIMYRR